MIRTYRGFTVIELMVTISIMTVIMSVILFAYGKFSERLSLNAAVQEISIAIRQTQTYGLSVKESGGAFNAGYGIYFNITDPTNYYIFVDKNNDQMYDGGASCASSGDCLVENIPLRNAVILNSICGAAFGGSLNCPADVNNPSGQSIKGMTITFLRPSTDAIIRFIKTDNTFYGGVFQTGKVNLRSVQGSTVGVTVENTGQISVQ